MKKILIVDDDITIQNLLTELLTKEGYHVLNAYSGTETLLLLEKENVDLVLLDLMIPGISGEDLIKKIKYIPIIVISAKIMPNDKVNCLLQGANDYITKPFDLNELIARITVQLRNNQKNNKQEIIEFKEIKLNINNHTFIINDNKIKFTKTEYAIMKLLLTNPNKVFSKNNLLDLIRDDTEDCDEGSLKVHISNIRKKIRNYTTKEYIESVWGIGFRLKE